MSTPSYGVRTYAKPSNDEFAPLTMPLVPVVLEFPFTHADLDANDIFKVPMEKGLLVLSTALLIRTAFNVATAVVVGIVGGDTDAFIESGTVNPTSAGAFHNSAGGGAAAAQGSAAFRTASGVIGVDFNGNASAGEGTLYVTVLAPAQSWRKADADAIGY